MLKRRSVTLLELMVVIVIVAILATLGLPNLAIFVERERAKNAEANLMIIYNAEKRYRLDNGEYFPGGAVADTTNKVNNGLGTYISDPYFTYKITSTIVNKVAGYTATAERGNQGPCAGGTMTVSAASSSVIKNCSKW